MNTPAPASSRRLRWLLLGGCGLALAILHFSGLEERFWPYLKDHLQEVQEATEQHFLLALLIFYLIYVGITGLSLPFSILLGLTAGALFGRLWGTGVISLASTSGATVAFLLSRYLFREAVQTRFGDRIAPFEKGFARDGAYYLLTLRLIPAVPFFLINLGMGLTPIRTRTYWWATQLGMLPANFLFVNAGVELGKLDSPRGLLSPTTLLSLALLGLVPLILRGLVRGWEKARGMGPIENSQALEISRTATGSADRPCPCEDDKEARHSHSEDQGETR